MKPRRPIDRWLDVGSFAVGVLTEALAQLRRASARAAVEAGGPAAPRPLRVDPARPRLRRLGPGPRPAPRRPRRPTPRPDKP